MVQNINDLLIKHGGMGAPGDTEASKVVLDDAVKEIFQNVLARFDVGVLAGVDQNLLKALSKTSTNS